MSVDILCFCDWIGGWMFRRTECRMSPVLWILADSTADMGEEMRKGLLLGVNREKESLVPKVMRFCLRRLTSSMSR